MRKKDLYQVSLKAILTNGDNKLLALKAHTGGSLAGSYDLPGGRINDDEFNVSPESILEREIKEEVGNIEFTVNKYPVAIGRHLVPAKGGNQEIHIFYIFFKGEIKSEEIKTSDEHSGFSWIDFPMDNPEKYFKSGILEGVKMYLEKISKE
ncbi:hypothetical protein A2316_00875 [Candidatus Falkowbacteria bacterium RIFOXYB2_FULL_38_15]|uniref:Nudix hydrolase domain-containing protein n=1 Tax=Candidatus Falkowbacteria bacterium RIFOXYA2_FULL_38_12 TaxID=1797993 RepID=A0A1F5S4K2_9BACT|nr:MAG: hypothetical protein A2257_02280 [Candidatus Falkowbacteria bacterium RIFOXYA2_FULL_38_12]OGF32747.1 MAG: hypothetical protein A2316_00875 [Candidatus Falkowbacteria bacterium RIFOXYB2_FULL_38_15]OGF42217.1 MAG: hypothetical protein A2555_03020 [Candidatus Falkowbacteria bacterium RIFOXYD2_FULL_39_16]